MLGRCGQTVKPWALACLFITMLFGLQVLGSQDQVELVPITRGPWVTAVAPGEVRVSFQLAAPQGGTLLYGEEDNHQLTSSVDFSSQDTLKHVVLANLEPGNIYYYRITLEDGCTSLTGKFISPPLQEFAPFSFVVYGDTRTHYDRHELVARQMAQEDVSFVVHVGDLIENPTKGEWDAFFSSGAELLLNKIFFSVIGNHERNSSTYYELFPMPNAGGVYERTQGQWWRCYWHDVLLVGLDSNVEYLGFSGLDRETEWLEETLSLPARFKIVFFHHPFFSSSYTHEGKEGLGKIWHPIFVSKGVNIVFNGHIHAYEHFIRDGIHYITTGGGGAPPSSLGPLVEGEVFSVTDMLHYVKIEVADDKLRVIVVPVAQSILGSRTCLESFSVPRRSSAKGVLDEGG